MSTIGYHSLLAEHFVASKNTVTSDVAMTTTHTADSFADPYIISPPHQTAYGELMEMYRNMELVQGVP